MISYTQTNTIVITCHKWLAPHLAKEVEALGFKTTSVFQTGVTLQGTINDCIKLNLHLRTASQVLFLLKEFECNSPDDLYYECKKINWQNIIDSTTYFSITSNVFHPTINNNLFANVRVKDAIVDVIKAVDGKRPNSGNELSGAVFHLHWKNNTATMYIDTSGQSLGRHGYRKIPGKAPMLEALAAAAVIAGKWNANQTFLNPMCGSGTVAIEAALIATNRKPGLLRNNYAFMHLLGYNDAVYVKELQQLFEIIKPIDFQIIASDISADAVKIAGINAEHAEVEDIVEFVKCDYQVSPVPNAKGVVFINPEYGERLGDATHLEEVYAGIGNFFKQKCKGYTGYIFTGNLDLAKKIGLKASRRIEFLNGKIDCRLLEYDLYDGTKRTDSVSIEQ